MAPDIDPDMLDLSRRAWGDLEALHVVGYFAPELTAAYVDLGLHPRLSYFAARSAAFGPVEPGVAVATFYVFAPWLVGAALPAAWDIASPARVLAARHEGMSAALRGILGEPDVAEALDIAHRVCDGLSAHGRPLYAAHAALPWPQDDLLALWHAATLVREHRGDGHVSVLLSSGWDPVEALVLNGLFSSNTGFLRKTRGWSDEEWASAQDRLRERGLISADAELTDAGKVARQRAEDETDALAIEGWAHVGASDTSRLHDLLSPLRKKVLTSGVLPRWIDTRG